MARRDLAKDATLTLPGVTRPVGRPRTGCAKTAAERMQAYRARRAAQAAEFPSPVTEIPDEWEIPPQDPAPGCDSVQLDPVTKKHRDSLVDNVQGYQYHRNGNPYQQHCAFFEREAVVSSLAKLGGLASVW